jgi:hypothetical protein
VQATWDLVKEDCRIDPRRERECDPGKVLDFVAKRPVSVLRELGG